MNLGPTFDRSCWLDVKETLGLDFPNVSIYHHVHFFLSDLQRNRRFIILLDTPKCGGFL